MELRFSCVLRVQKVPRFGELLVSVPSSATAINIAQVALDIFMGQEQPHANYALRGCLGRTRFESHGEVAVPVWPGEQAVRL